LLSASVTFAGMQASAADAGGAPTMRSVMDMGIHASKTRLGMALLAAPEPIRAVPPATHANVGRGTGFGRRMGWMSEAIPVDAARPVAVQRVKTAGRPGPWIRRAPWHGGKPSSP